MLAGLGALFFATLYGLFTMKKTDSERISELECMSREISSCGDDSPYSVHRKRASVRLSKDLDDSSRSARLDKIFAAFSTLLHMLILKNRSHLNRRDMERSSSLRWKVRQYRCVDSRGEKFFSDFVSRRLILPWDKKRAESRVGCRGPVLGVILPAALGKERFSWVRIPVVPETFLMACTSNWCSLSLGLYPV